MINWPVVGILPNNNWCIATPNVKIPEKHILCQWPHGRDKRHHSVMYDGKARLLYVIYSAKEVRLYVTKTLTFTELMNLEFGKGATSSVPFTLEQLFV